MAAQCIIQHAIILEKTIWPAPDSDEDMDDQLEDSCKVTGFLRQYIEHGTSQELKKLVQFWVGWTSLPQHLYVEVSRSVPMPHVHVETPSSSLFITVPMRTSVKTSKLLFQ
ncbi:hypothetical protein MHYP_G00314160 [Metynnis hypsauchen]